VIRCETVALALEVTYESAAGMAADWESQLKLGGLFAEVEAPPTLEAFAALTLRLKVEGAAPIEAAARLTAVSAGSLCLEVLTEARAGLERAIGLACAELGGGGPTARRSAQLIDDSPPRHATPVAMTLERKLMAMSVSEKVALALHGAREERALLARDRAGVVQASLVRNPKVTLDELCALARSPLLAPEGAEALAQHPGWGASPQIAAALARNPRTPIRAAVEALDHVAPSELRALAKAPGVRPQVTQAARKKLLGE
jgi:hypothetical protein